MKWIAIIITILLIAIIGIGYAIGGLALGIILGSIFGLIWTIAIFALGSWWSANLLRNGAQIALSAQESDDRRDGQQIGQIAALVREVIKSERNYNNIEKPHYPALPDNGGASFTITGFEEN